MNFGVNVYIETREVNARIKSNEAKFFFSQEEQGIYICHLKFGISFNFLLNHFIIKSKNWENYKTRNKGCEITFRGIAFCDYLFPHYLICRILFEKNIYIQNIQINWSHKKKYMRWEKNDVERRRPTKKKRRKTTWLRKNQKIAWIYKIAWCNDKSQGLLSPSIVDTWKRPTAQECLVTSWSLLTSQRSLLSGYSSSIFIPGLIRYTTLTKSRFYYRYMFF